MDLIKAGLEVKWKYDGYNDSVYLADNPLTIPPPEIVKEGRESVLNYFAELKTQGSVPIYEAKLLIIGEGGAGKTSLARKLINEDALLPEEEESTKGIDIFHYDFKTKEGNDFRINIWDFGGQEIYHSTHQFFLTKRSLYILLDDTRKDDKSVNDATFNYWLQVVELLSESSPVLIIQNEKADRSKALELKGMQGRFENIKGSWATNLLDGRGLAEVRKQIEWYVQQLPLVGELLPKQWVAIRRALEKLAETKDYISLEEYFEVCANHKIPEEDRALMLSGYLHDLGSFLHFGKDFILKNLFILRNTWATDAVYQVLDNEAVKGANGYFTEKNLTEVWSEKRFKNKQPQLLALMEKFQLCFELKDKAKKTWLAPQLLEVDAPDFDWDETNNLVLRYEYEFMPKGLLSRFFVRMNRYVSEPEKAWRSGVFMHRQNTDAFIRETYGSREIAIRVRGKRPQELMTILSEDLDAMHKSYGEKLRVKKLIPCNCPKCKSLANPNFYDFEDLRRRQEKGKPTVECKISYDDVHVGNLLGDVFTKVEKTEADFDRKATPQNRTIELFLASSYELAAERKEIELWIGRENKHLNSKGIFLKLNIWEDFLDSMNKLRKQDDYNEAVVRSDIFISLFATKVGKYSEEEFMKAFGNFMEKGQPKYIYTYFKKSTVDPLKVNLDEIQNLQRFNTFLEKLGHFPNHFGDSNDLILQLKKQLDKIFEEEGI